MSNDNTLKDVVVSGTGGFVLPDGMTMEEAERLARQADEQRKDD